MQSVPCDRDAQPEELLSRPALQDGLQGRSWLNGVGRLLPHKRIEAVIMHVKHECSPKQDMEEEWFVHAGEEKACLVEHCGRAGSPRPRHEDAHLVSAKSTAEV